jgi:hypothetical protein
MKTAMQELIEYLRSLAFSECHLGMGDIMLTQGHIDEIEEKLLEKEKQQIIHAFNCGESFSVDYFNPETPEVAPSVNYYIQSYQNK